MGATLSNLTEGGGNNGPLLGPGLGDIPESCVACVFDYLTPPEICNLARLNKAFRGAASSDSVWEKKLPQNFQDILGLISRDRGRQICKKDIFALLSRPTPLEDGNKVVWLDRVTGRVCLSVSAKGLAITGVEDRRYWTWLPTEESRFHIVAYLQQIWWFEVDGVLDFPFPPDVYSLYFRLHLGKFFKKLGRRVCTYDHTHGWTAKPVKFELSTSDGQQASCEYYLDETEHNEGNGIPKRGCWIDYKVGEFIVFDSDPSTEVKFSMKQIDCTHTKGGICIDSVFIVPRNFRDQKRYRIT